MGIDGAFMQVAFVATDVMIGELYVRHIIGINQRSTAPLHFLNSYFLARSNISN
jgi:hypothetical protein